MKAPDEDRPTIAERLMTNPMAIERESEFDEVLERKIEHLLELFRRRSNGLMNSTYFNDLKNGLVNEQYWKENNIS